MKIIERDIPETTVQALVQSGISPLLARLYVARGVQSCDELDTGLTKLLPPAGLMGIQAAARVLADAIAAQKRICIVADYDCDGATACLLQPWFAEDGMQLEMVQPQRWCVSGQPLAQLHTASLDRVLLRDVTPWLPPVQTARKLHRLHSEVQMLLYADHFNDQRAERGLAPINAFWLHGAGQLSTTQLAQVRQRQSQVHLQLVDDLRQTALRQDWPAWKQAWLAADAGPVAALVQHIAQGGQATLTLCGEHHARSFDTTARSLRDKIKNIFSPQRFAGLHQAL